MENNKYPIPDEILTATIEAMRALNMRMEAEAAGKLFEFYLNL